MPAVLVHGVPDTPRPWDRLRAHLARRDLIAPALPGFGVPVPAGFTATKEAYVEWLIEDTTSRCLVDREPVSAIVKRIRDDAYGRPAN